MYTGRCFSGVIFCALSLLQPCAAFAWPNLTIDSVETLQLPVSAIVYSPFNGKIYASIPSNGGARANTVTPIDPITGAVGTSIPVGNNPGKLAASDDGRFLYVVSGDGNRIEKLDVASETVALSFNLGNFAGNPVKANDIEVMPGRPETVAIVCLNGLQEVRIYDNGTPRTQAAAGGIVSIEFSTNASLIFGISYTSFSTIAVTPNGASVSATTFGPFEPDADIAFSGRLLFSTSKGVFDPNTLEGSFPFYGRSGFAYHAPLAVDGAARRACYVLPKESFIQNFRFQIFDLDTYLPVGEISIPSPPGYFTGTLIRWGADGLAYHADTNQIIFLRTSLLPTAPAADLIVRQEFVPAGASSNAWLHCSVENSGPNPARQVKLRATFSGTVSFGSIVTSSGLYAVTNNQLICDFGDQAVGATNHVTIQFNAPPTNTVLATATASSLSDDLITGNNTSMLMLSLPELATTGSVFSVALALADLVADPVRGGIFLAVDRQVPNLGNGVVYFDPGTGVFSHSAFVGSDIRKLAVSADGQKLYASSAEKISELNPASLQILRSFSLPANSVATEIAVYPDDANRLAVWHENLPNRLGETRAIGLGVYTNGAPAATNWQTLFGSRRIAVRAGSDLLKVISPGPVLRLESFVAVGPVLTNLSSIEEWYLDYRGEVRVVQDRLYAPYGHVYDLLSHRSLGTFNIPGIDGWPQNSAGAPLVEPDLQNGRAFFLRYSGTEVKLHAFDAKRYQNIGSMTVPGVILPPQRLIRWGSDGFAFMNDKLFIVRSTLVPSGAKADLVARLSGGANPGRINQSEAYSLTITNRGPEAATGVVALVTFSTSGAVAGVTSSQGTTMVSNLVIRYDVGSLAMGATASMDFVLTPTSSGLFQVTASVSGKCHDRDPSNDMSTHLELVTDDEWPPTITQLRLPVNDAVSERLRTNLFVSLHELGGAIGNSVIKLDPQSGRVLGPVFVGSNPNRLAVSSDGTTLYVGIDGASAVQVIDAATLQPLASFGISNGIRADLMEVVPGRSDQVLVSQTHEGLSLFEQGIEKGSRVKDISTFAFDEISGDVFGCNRMFSGVPLYRLAVGSNGVVVVESLPSTLQQSQSDLKAANGLLYYDRGLVVSTISETSTQPFPVTRFATARVQPVPERQLVYFLTALASRWTLRSFHDNGEPHAAYPVPGMAGVPSRISRWGSTGVAFATSSNQLFLVHDLFTSDRPAADVAVHRLTAPRTALPGNSATYVCIITNHSAVAAISTVVTQSFEFTGSLEQTDISMGGVQVFGPKIIWTVGNLNPYGSAQISVELVPTGNQTITSHANVATSSFDPLPGNNLAQAATAVRVFGTNPIVTTINLSIADLVYDPAAKLLWASITNAPSGSVVVPIDPIEGVVGPGIGMATETTRLGIDAHGSNLYCLQPLVGGVARISLESRRVDQFTFVRTNGTSQFSTPLDLAVSPSTARRIAVSYFSSSVFDKLVALVDDGVVQPRVARSSGADVIEFDGADDQVYGFNNTSSGSQLSTLAVTNGGLALMTEGSGLISGTEADIKRGGTRLFGSRGHVVDPRSRILVTNLSVSINAAAVEPVPGDGRVYYATRAPNGIRALSLTNFASLGTNLLPGISGDVRSLVRWGVNGLAMHTTGGQVVILRSSLVPVPVGQDTDADGTPDEWESRFGFNPYDNVDAAMDLDSDGLSNYAEYQAGTHPHNGLSSLRIKRASRQDATIAVVFSSVNDRIYRLEGRSEVSGTSAWQTIVDGIQGTGGDITNLVPVTSTNRFVRVRTQP
jgi:DNA-binding beta-propeller fold protein YncE